MAESRTFPLADVLSVTTPLMLSERGEDGLTDLLNFMTGDELEMWQLPRAADEAQPVLIAQHPFLAELQPPAGLSKLGLRIWLMNRVLKHGATLDVQPLTDWVHQHPIQEFVDRVELASLTTPAPPTPEES